MSLVVRVFAPVGRDAELIVALLASNQVAVEACHHLPVLIEDLKAHALGPVIIAEEALNAECIRMLAEILGQQPTWSDLPILVLTSSGRENLHSLELERARLPLGSPVLLERPIRTATLLSSVKAAVRARKRQYEVRDAFAERDEALAALSQERELLQVVLDNLPVGVLGARPSGEIFLANRSVQTILRHPVKETLNTDGHSHWIAFHADGRRLTSEEYPLVRALRSGRSVPPEDYLYQRGDGTVGWVRLIAAPILDTHGNITGGVVAIADIDQQKQATEAVRRSEDRFRRLIESASVGVMIGDYLGGVTYANPALLDVLGYTPEDVQSGLLRWDVLTPAEYGPRDSLAIEQLKANGTAAPYQKELRAKDGRLVPFLFGPTRIPAPQESPQKDEVAVFLTDLSIQKQAEAALVQNEKIAAVGRLAASISHEINNPLEAITNLLYIARTSGDLAQVHQRLDEADRELARVSQIVTQTLQFHRQSTKPRSVRPEELIASALALYQGRLSNFRIVLERQDRQARSVVCYEGNIRQVLNNLVGNAIDAMRRGGRLVIRASNAQRWRTRTPGVRITIADTGHGMTPEVLGKIFQAFYTTKGHNGTGLGLWISKGIAEKHGGLLQVRSSTRARQSGTVFSLFLPSLAESSTIEERVEERAGEDRALEVRAREVSPA